MKKQLPRFAENNRDNLVYKIVSFFVALAIWVTTLHGRKDTIIERAMDLEFIMKQGFVTSSQMNEPVRVKVAGPRVQLKKFRDTAKAIKVNLANASAGEHIVKILKEDIDLPVGVRLIEVTPENVNVIVKEVR